MIATLMFSSLALAAPAPSAADFKVSVTITQAGETPKTGTLEFARGKCSSMNGRLMRVQPGKVCKAIGEQIARDDATYTVMPWINNPDVPSLVVEFKNSKSSWIRETGVMPDKDSKPREALRALAVKILETAK